MGQGEATRDEDLPGRIAPAEGFDADALCVHQEELRPDAPGVSAEPQGIQVRRFSWVGGPPTVLSTSRSLEACSQSLAWMGQTWWINPWISWDRIAKGVESFAWAGTVTQSPIR